MGLILRPDRKIWIEVCTVFSVLLLTKDPLFDFCATSLLTVYYLRTSEVIIGCVALWLQEHCQCVAFYGEVILGPLRECHNFFT